MRLGISSATAPDASFDELLSACVQRGLGALELRAGHGHGLSAVAGEVLAADARERAAEAHIVIAGFRTDDATDAPALAALSRALAAPVIVDGSVFVEQRIERALAIVAAGGDAVVAARGAAREWAEHVQTGTGYVWDADPLTSDVATDLEHVLAGALPHAIGLQGGGPESAMHEGRGVGALMGRLALAGYRGPLILAPSSTRYRVAWETWLGRRGGWGCGSSGERSLTALQRAERS
jgi:hypothetical protein